MAKILEDLSHDSVNRFLLRERYEPKDLFDQIKPHINLLEFGLIDIQQQSIEWLEKITQLLLEAESS